MDFEHIFAMIAVLSGFFIFGVIPTIMLILSIFGFVEFNLIYLILSGGFLICMFDGL